MIPSIWSEQTLSEFVIEGSVAMKLTAVTSGEITTRSADVIVWSANFARSVH